MGSPTIGPHFQLETQKRVFFYVRGCSLSMELHSSRVEGVPYEKKKKNGAHRIVRRARSLRNSWWDCVVPSLWCLRPRKQLLSVAFVRSICYYICDVLVRCRLRAVSFSLFWFLFIPPMIFALFPLSYFFSLPRRDSDPGSRKASPSLPSLLRYVPSSLSREKNKAQIATNYFHVHFHACRLSLIKLQILFAIHR